MNLDHQRDELLTASARLDASPSIEFLPLKEYLRELAQTEILAVMLSRTNIENPKRIFEAQQLTERLAFQSPSIAMIVGALRIQSVMLAKLDSTFVRDKWLAPMLSGEILGSIAVTEENAGSDVRGMTSTLQLAADGGGVLSGRKTQVALAPMADFAIVLAKVGGNNRTANMALVIVERGGAGVIFEQTEPLMSYEKFPMGGISFDQAPISSKHLLLPDGGLEAFLAVVNFARIEAASHGIGILSACLAACLARTRVRQVNDRPLAEFQKVQDLIGSMRIDLEASRGIRDKAAERYASGVPDLALAAAAKVFATDSAAKHTAEAVGIFGADGLRAGSRIATLFRDAKAAQTFDGANHLLRLVVGQQTLKAFSDH